MNRVWKLALDTCGKRVPVLAALGLMAVVPLTAHAAIYGYDQDHQIVRMDVAPHRIIPEGSEFAPHEVITPAYERPPVESAISPTTAHAEPVMGAMTHAARHRVMHHHHHRVVRHHHVRAHAAK